MLLALLPPGRSVAMWPRTEPWRVHPRAFQPWSCSECTWPSTQVLFPPLPVLWETLLIDCSQSPYTDTAGVGQYLQYLHPGGTSKQLWGPTFVLNTIVKRVFFFRKTKWLLSDLTFLQVNTREAQSHEWNKHARWFIHLQQLQLQDALTQGGPFTEQPHHVPAHSHLHNRMYLPSAVLT